ncbi:MAG: hypothetical protein M0R48_10410 [Candidatus Omnitrophica bacterium]|jgi:hypothetical protein|nr:hypothetical protein [Candidatus Omnitrophota bacterium]
MLKVIITIIFVYILIRLLVRLIFLAFGVFLSRTLKAKYSNTVKNGFSARKESDSENIIDAEFKEVNKP